MEVNAGDFSNTQPDTQTSSDINSALSITDAYVDTGVNKLEKVTSVVLGENSKAWGLTGENMKRVMIFIGAYTSLNFIWQKAGKHKFQVFGGLIGIYLLRRMYESQSSQSDTNNQA